MNEKDIIKRAIKEVVDKYKDELIEKTQYLMWIYDDEGYTSDEAMETLVSMMKSYGYKPKAPEEGEEIHFGISDLDE